MFEAWIVSLTPDQMVVISGYKSNLSRDWLRPWLERIEINDQLKDLNANIVKIFRFKLLLKS
ncbi:hypothetical protein [Vibrio phage J14]|nr:hypothetical protein [Vibrio phage J14]